MPRAERSNSLTPSVRSTVGDVLRDAGLRGVLALRRARERAFLADGDDGADLPQRDIGHAMLHQEN